MQGTPIQVFNQLSQKASTLPDAQKIAFWKENVQGLLNQVANQQRYNLNAPDLKYQREIMKAQVKERLLNGLISSELFDHASCKADLEKLMALVFDDLDKYVKNEIAQAKGAARVIKAT